jgi:hypothetical protein
MSNRTPQTAQEWNDALNRSTTPKQTNRKSTDPPQHLAETPKSKRKPDQSPASPPPPAPKAAKNNVSASPTGNSTPAVATVPAPQEPPLHLPSNSQSSEQEGMDEGNHSPADQPQAEQPQEQPGKSQASQLDSNRPTITIEDALVLYHRSFAVSEQTDLDPLLLAMEAETYGSIDLDNCYLSRSGKTFHVAFLDPKSVEDSKNHVGEFLKAQASGIEPRTELRQISYVMALKYVSTNKELLQPEVVISILQNSALGNHFRTLSKSDVFLNDTKRGKLINVILDSKDAFIAATASDYLSPMTLTNLGRLYVVHAMCYTNDPEYIKLYVRGLRTIKSRAAVFNALVKAGTTPLVTGISKDTLTNYPEGYGFIIVRKEEVGKLDPNTTQITVDGHLALRFEPTKPRSKRK